MHEFMREKFLIGFLLINAYARNALVCLLYYLKTKKVKNFYLMLHKILARINIWLTLI